ncbi:MAG: RidA family protein [Phascolarctobacterium sp.]|nr:RidA family protein [Phascolarctobacterium sp.]
MKKQIVTKNAPGAVGPYSQAIVVGNTLYVSGQIPLNPATGELVKEIGAAAQQVLENLQAILTEAGYSMADVVKTVVYLADIDDFTKVNEIYAKYFREPYPARSCVAVKDLPKGALLEIECIAAK